MPNTQGDPLSTTTEVDELHQLIEAVRRCAASLVRRHGDCPAIRRIVNDVERILNGIDRLDIDLEELGLTIGLGRPTVCTEMVQIPDIQYDHDFWRDVDHEGIGGQNGACVQVSRNGKRR
jgi:hypothetical protein